MTTQVRIAVWRQDASSATRILAHLVDELQLSSFTVACASCAIWPNAIQSHTMVKGETFVAVGGQGRALSHHPFSPRWSHSH
jgi:hypothetical protein